MTLISPCLLVFAVTLSPRGARPPPGTLVMRVSGRSGGNGVRGVDRVGVRDGADKFHTSHGSQLDELET